MKRNKKKNQKNGSHPVTKTMVVFFLLYLSARVLFKND